MCDGSFEGLIESDVERLARFYSFIVRRKLKSKKGGKEQETVQSK